MSNEERGDTSITINKEDLPLFNEYRAREAGRRRESSISHPEFLKLLLSLYHGAENADLEAAQRRTERKPGKKTGRDRS